MKTAFTLLFFFFSVQFLFAQQPDSLAGLFSARFLAGIPQGDFADKMDDNAFGLDVAYLARVGNSPVYVGGSFVYLHFSRYKIDVDIPIGQTGFDEEYNWITASQAIFLQTSVRFQPEHEGLFKPYLEGSLGARRLFTNTRLENRNYNNESYYDDDLEVADWSISYSGKAGVQVAVTKDGILALDLGCTYSYAGGGEFYRKKDNPGPVSDPLDAFELKRASATALLIPSAGFTLSISRGFFKE